MPVRLYRAAGKPGLSDRELALARWFSALTFMQDRTAMLWLEWHDDGRQLGTTSLRYQVAFSDYGCAALAAKTPAYHELAGIWRGANRAVQGR